MHVDVIVLALMLAYVIVVVIRVSYRCHTARRGRGIEDFNRRKVAAELSAKVGNLKSIALAAPYCGLVGTCAGILSASGFSGGIAMERNTFLAMMATRIAAALFTTAAGILVALPASCSYNFFRPRLDTLEDELSSGLKRSQRLAAGRLSLRKRFSQMPAFAMIAAPGLAILVAVETPFFAPREPTGFGVDLASEHCQSDGDDRLIVLHITDAGELFINTEQEHWNNLAGRLAEIYGMRVYRTLYLVADAGVPFQTVADAIDVAENAATPESKPLDIRIRLITPRAMNARCPQPVAVGASGHASR